VARFGGDEFVVVLAGCGADEGDAAAGSEMVAKKILAALNQRYLLGGVVHHSSASVGVTLFRGDHAVMDDLMKQADMAMYRAKAAGRNLIRFFDPTLESAVKERMTLEEDLRRALDERQLLLHYQAQVTGSGQIMGAEALIRWQHPLRGMVPPVEFIPLSEESGLILHLGRWVLEAACAQLAAWSGQAAMAHLTVSVNVSARQFHQPDFVDQVLAVIKNSGANPARLKLELTESLLIENIEDVIVKMSALQKIGIGFSLDDFGTGYSSLSYLSRLPLDQLKIDRSFVMNIDAGDNAVAICAATISLAHSLNLKVVAEGVETEAQRFLLSSVHRCDLFQGYLFSRPLPVEGFEDLVNRGTAS
jgi:EAL domain-containing protein (putative c-di-GMP-specific phosphodiesterase class I)